MHGTADGRSNLVFIRGIVKSKGPFTPGVNVREKASPGPPTNQNVVAM